MAKTKLTKGLFVKAKFVRANLFEIDLTGAMMDATDLSGANLKMTKLYKRTDLLPDKKDKGLYENPP